MTRSRNWGVPPGRATNTGRQNNSSSGSRSGRDTIEFACFSPSARMATPWHLKRSWRGGWRLTWVDIRAQ
eukprot:13943127-Alexandrium_andersonii.AAC.1